MGEETELNAGTGTLFAGRYMIKKTLGEGGMGKVYLVSDLMLDGEMVALKILHEDLSQDEKHTRRFLREIQLTRKVTHPNIVRTFDVGTLGQRLFFTMEYAAGSTLRQILNDGPIEPVTAALVMVEICKGLTAIHQAGIIHRDVKASNVIITSEDRVKITDFGVARTKMSDVTAQNEVVGSIRYIAPEVWAGGEIGAASDLYSLGVLSYYLVTGIFPFEGATPAELMCKHLKNKAVAPVQIVEDIPVWLNSIILRLIEKTKERRPSTAMAVAEEIELNLYPGREDALNFEAPPPELTGPLSAVLPEDDTENELPPGLRQTDLNEPGVELSRPIRPAPPQSGNREAQHVSALVEGVEVSNRPHSSVVLRTLALSLCKLPAALAACALMAYLAVGPLGALIQMFWRMLAERKEMGVLPFIIGVLPIVAICALLAAVPVLGLAIVLSPVRRICGRWMVMTFYVTILAALLLLINTARLAYDWKKSGGPVRPIVLIISVQESMQGSIKNLAEAALLIPRGTLYAPESAGPLPAFIEKGKKGNGGGLLTYYSLLFGYLFSLAAVCRFMDGTRGGGRAVLFLLVPIFGGLCLVEELVHPLFLTRPGWDLTSGFRPDLGPFRLSLDRYALTCSALNWGLVLAVLICLSIDGARRRSRD